MAKVAAAQECFRAYCAESVFRLGVGHGAGDVWMAALGAGGNVHWRLRRPIRATWAGGGASGSSLHSTPISPLHTSRCGPSWPACRVQA